MFLKILFGIVAPTSRKEASSGVERLVVDPHHESPARPKGLELLKRHREVEIPKEDLENGLEVDMADECPLVLDRIHRLVVVGLAEIPEDFMEKEPLVVARAEDLSCAVSDPQPLEFSIRGRWGEEPGQLGVHVCPLRGAASLPSTHEVPADADGRGCRAHRETCRSSGSPLQAAASC